MWLTLRAHGLKLPYIYYGIKAKLGITHTQTLPATPHLLCPNKKPEEKYRIPSMCYPFSKTVPNHHIRA